jgi:hypothetical protein
MRCQFGQRMLLRSSISPCGSGCPSRLPLRPRPKPRAVVCSSHVRSTSRTGGRSCWRHGVGRRGESPRRRELGHRLRSFGAGATSRRCRWREAGYCIPVTLPVMPPPTSAAGSPGRSCARACSSRCGSGRQRRRSCARRRLRHAGTDSTPAGTAVLMFAPFSTGSPELAYANRLRPRSGSTVTSHINGRSSPSAQARQGAPAGTSSCSPLACSSRSCSSTWTRRRHKTTQRPTDLA